MEFVYHRRAIDNVDRPHTISQISSDWDFTIKKDREVDYHKARH